jgi:hypothetical protein
LFQAVFVAGCDGCLTKISGGWGTLLLLVKVCNPSFLFGLQTLTSNNNIIPFFFPHPGVFEKEMIKPKKSFLFQRVPQPPENLVRHGFLNRGFFFLLLFAETATISE